MKYKNIKIFCLIHLLPVILIIPITSYAKEEYKGKYDNAKNTIFVELLGNGPFYSINYDRIISCQSSSKTSLRFGYSLIPYFLSVNITSVIIEINLLKDVPDCRNSTEFGFGITEVYWWPSDTGPPDDTGFTTLLFLRIGFRYQNPINGWVMRFGFTPTLISGSSEFGTIPFPWVGFGMGTSF